MYSRIHSAVINSKFSPIPTATQRTRRRVPFSLGSTEHIYKSPSSLPPLPFGKVIKYLYASMLKTSRLLKIADGRHKTVYFPKLCPNYTLSLVKNRLRYRIYERITTKLFIIGFPLYKWFRYLWLKKLEIAVKVTKRNKISISEFKKICSDYFCASSPFPLARSVLTKFKLQTRYQSILLFFLFI